MQESSRQMSEPKKQKGLSRQKHQVSQKTYGGGVVPLKAKTDTSER